MENTRQRPRVPIGFRRDAIVSLEAELDRNLDENGTGTFASTHEILGVLTEEYTKLIAAVRSNEVSDVRKKLLALAVGCVFAVACIDAQTLDW